MTARVIKGSKQEIAEQVARMDGDVREAIVFVTNDADVTLTPHATATASGEDMFAEMDQYTVEVGNADYSRESIYTRLPGE